MGTEKTGTGKHITSKDKQMSFQWSKIDRETDKLRNFEDADGVVFFILFHCTQYE